MYAKVFAQIYDGTLCTKGPWQALVTFQQMLVLADKDGCVDMTAEAISRRTTIPVDIIKIGLAALMEPDAESRTPTAEGRRLVPLRESNSWGWQVVNYAHYRSLKREEDRREYHRNYWHTRKEKLNTTQPAQPNQPIAEAEAEADREQSPTVIPALRKAQAPPTPPKPLKGDNIDSIPVKARVLLDPAFDLPLAWGEDGERLGWSAGQLLRESEKFRQYFVAGKGAGTRRSVKGWRQSWSNWLANAEKYESPRRAA